MAVGEQFAKRQPGVREHARDQIKPRFISGKPAGSLVKAGKNA